MNSIGKTTGSLMTVLVLMFLVGAILLQRINHENIHPRVAITAQSSNPSGQGYIVLGPEHECCFNNLTSSSPIWTPPFHDSTYDCGNYPVKTNQPGGTFALCAGTGGPTLPVRTCSDGDCARLSRPVRYKAHQLIVYNDDTEVVITTCGYRGADQCPHTTGECFTPTSPPVDLYLYRNEMICDMPCQNLVAYDAVGTIGGMWALSSCRGISVRLDAGTYFLIVSQNHTSTDLTLENTGGVLPYSVNIVTETDTAVSFQCTTNNESCVPGEVSYCNQTLSSTDEITTAGIYLGSQECKQIGIGNKLNFDSFAVQITRPGFVEFDLCGGPKPPQGSGFMSMELYDNTWSPTQRRSCDVIGRTSWDWASDCDEDDYPYKSGRLRIRVDTPGSYWLVVIHSRPLNVGESVPYRLSLRSETGAAYLSCYPHDWPSVDDNVSKTLSGTDTSWNWTSMCMEVSLEEALGAVLRIPTLKLRLSDYLRVDPDDVLSTLLSIDFLGDATNVRMCFPDVTRIETRYEMRYRSEIQADGGIQVHVLGLDLQGSVGTDYALNFRRSNQLEWRPGHFIQSPRMYYVGDGRPLPLIFKRINQEKSYGPPSVYSFCAKLASQQQADPSCDPPIWGPFPIKSHDHRSARAFGAQQVIMEAGGKWSRRATFTAPGVPYYRHLVHFMGTFEQLQSRSNVIAYYNGSTDNPVNLDEAFHANWSWSQTAYNYAEHDLEFEGFIP